LAPVRAALVIGLAAVLKLYPIVAAVILLRRSRRFLVAGGALALAFALYLFVIRDDIEPLQKATPKIVWNSFGIGVLTDGLASGQFGVIDPVAGFAPGQTLRSVVTLGVPIAVAIVGLVLAQRLPPLSRDERDWRADGLLVAAGLSVATYIFGHNFDYRLVFVLLAVPQLLAWTRSPGSWAWLARAALVAMGLTLWTGTAEGTARWGYELLGQSPKSAPGMFFPLDELTNIAMQALLAAGAFAILRQRLVARRPPVPSAAAPVPA
jgi:hypothetical protein